MRPGMWNFFNTLRGLLPQNMVERKLFVAAFGIAILFAVYTDHLWEDYYITYRASKNLAMGKGLVFTEGQRVHSFTSPIGVLLPAACSAVTLNQSDTVAIWLFRAVACGFLGLTAILLYRLAERANWGRWAKVFLIGLFVFDAKTVDYSINGMETAFLVYFLALTLYALVSEEEGSWRLLGCAWAGLMWTRPDAFIYIGVTAVTYALFSRGRDWKSSLRQYTLIFLKAGLLTTCLYLPWLLWAGSYYGSPVPHTIVAKGLGRPHIGAVAYLRAFIAFPVKIVIESTSMYRTLAPALPQLGPWPEPCWWLWRILPLVPAVYWVIPKGDPLARACSAAFVVGHFYLTRISPHPFSWYLPPVTLLALFPLADAVHRVWRWIEAKNVPSFKRGVVAAIVGILVMHGFTFLLIARQMKTQQAIVENGLRKELGFWLRANASGPADTVFLEPLGYIGYFSQLKMLDWPGLSSPEMIAARKQSGYLDYLDMRLIGVLQPDWVVLREVEYGPELKKKDSYLKQHYEAAKVFDVSAEIKKSDLHYGRGYLEFDQHFTVFKRIGPKVERGAFPVSSR